MNGKIWVLGDAVVDLLPDGEGPPAAMPPAAHRPTSPWSAWRGSAATAGLLAASATIPSAALCVTPLAQEKVDVDFMRLDAAQRTSTVVVDLDQHGERTLLYGPSERRPVPSARGSPAVCRRPWLHVCSIALSAEPRPQHGILAAMEAIKRAGGYVSFDPNIRSDLWQDPQDLRDQSRPGAGPRRRHKTLGRGAGLCQRQRRHRQRHRPAERPLPADAAAGDPGAKRGPGRPAQGRLATSPLARWWPLIPPAPAMPLSPGCSPASPLTVSLENLAALAPDLTLAQTCGALATTAKGAKTALPLQGRSSALTVIPLGRLTAHFAGETSQFLNRFSNFYFHRVTDMFTILTKPV